MIEQKKISLPTEEYEQILLITWLNKNNILNFSIPNGGHRHQLEAFKLKRMGVKSGVPDICIPIPNDKYHGLYIELKRNSKKAYPSENQKYWILELSKNGYCAEVCKGFENAKELVKKYLNFDENMLKAS